MKKIYLLLLLISAAMFAQPNVNQPPPVQLCDLDQDNVEWYELSQLNAQILGNLNPNDHAISYHQTFVEAQSGFSPIPLGMPYMVMNNQVLFARVTENSAPDSPAIVFAEFVLNAPVTATIEGGGNFCQGMDGGTVTFTGFGGMSPYTFTYAINGGAPQTVTSTGPTVTLSLSTLVAGSYTYQLLEVTDFGQPDCSTIVNGTLVYTVNEMPVVSVDGGGEYCQHSEAGITVSFANGQAPYSVDVGLNGVFLGSYQSQTPNIFIPVSTAEPGTYVYSLFNLLTQGCFQASAPEQVFVINPAPSSVEASDMVIEDTAPFDGFALFDFSNQEMIYAQDATGVDVTFYPSQADAAAGVNPILSPYFNMANPEQIWARVQGPSGCYYLDSFYLIVTPPGTDAIFIPDANLKAALVAANPSVNTAMNAQGQNITVDTNQDGEIQISEAHQVATLNVNALNIQSVVGLKFFYNLTALYAQDNFIVDLDMSNMPWLQMLQAGNNQPLSAVNVSGNTGLESLYVQTGSLASLNVAGCTALEVLGCFSNDLTSLVLGNLPNLIMLDCGFNNLATLNFSGATNLQQLSAGFNQLTSIDVSMLPNLTALVVSSNQLSTIDVSENHSLNLLNVEANQLETAFIKNGSDEEFYFGGNNNLAYICADLTQIQAIEGNINFNENIVLTPYCTDEPGGDFNTIFGTVRFDGDGNGCDTGDLAQPFTKVRITDGASEGFVFLNSDLQYTFHTGIGNFEVTPDLENSTIFNVSPAVASVSFPNLLNNFSIHNFCITPNGANPDVEAIIAPLGVARPGFDSYYQIVVRNKGNQIVSGNLAFNYDDALTDFVASTPGPSNTSTGQLNFFFNNLSPFDIAVINVTLNVNAPTEVPPVNIGTILNFSVAATIGPDILPLDNTMDFNQTVVGAYDPNDKQCVEGNVVSPSEIGKYLHYVINFENTGNFPAENVVIRDVIDTDKFDLASLQVINASHSVTARVTGNHVEFFFKNINLGIGGHGNILLKIKTLETLVEGDIVTNKADIYFDYNYPIETNIASTAFQALSVGEQQLVGLAVYPNPSNGHFTMTAEDDILLVEVFDLTGRLLQVAKPVSREAEMDISSRIPGIYVVKVTTAAGTAALKIVYR